MTDEKITETPAEKAPVEEKKTAAPKEKAPVVEAPPAYDFENDAVVLKFKEKFGDKVLAVTCLPVEENNITLVVERTAIHDVCLFARHEKSLAFDLLSDLMGNHYTEGHYEVVYHLYSFQLNKRFRLKITCNDETESFDSVIDVWPTADWFEREIYDMYGLTVNNHPDLRRILMPDYWIGHPQRKDYEIKYVPERFREKWYTTDEDGNHTLTYDFLKDKRG